VPNKSYSGPVKPKLDGFNELPFTSAEALYNAQLAGQDINVGPVPTTNLPVRDPKSSSLTHVINPLSKHYSLTPVYVWGWSYSMLNYANPTLGVALKQLYVRRALQETVDQAADSAVAWRGYAVPTSGPVPTAPSGAYVAASQKVNGDQGPYPFNVTEAKNSLTSHGWAEQDGVMTCVDAGVAADQCGVGVAAGTKLNATVEYSSGPTSVSEQMLQWKSDASQAGIVLNLDSQPFNTVAGDTTTCKQTASTCGWQIAYLGYLSYGAVPAGNLFFLPDSAANYGSFNDPAMSQLVDATLHDDSLTTFARYETYATQQLPAAINMPDPYKVYAISTSLDGVTPLNPNGQILPENWYFTR
jgi:peptide/nickel transport system substrate-binding protein